MFDHGCAYTAQLLDISDIVTKRKEGYCEAVKKWPDARLSEAQTLLAAMRLAPGDKLVEFGQSQLNWHESIPAGVSYHQIDPLNEPGLGLGDPVFSKQDSVDWIVSTYGMQTCLQKKPIFDTFSHALRPGGQLILAEISQGSRVAKFMEQWVNGHSSSGVGGSYFNFRTLKELSDSGFTLLRMQEKTCHWIFKDERAAVEYCKALLGVDLAEDQAFLDALDFYLGFDDLEEGLGLRWQMQVISSIKTTRT